MKPFIAVLLLAGCSTPNDGFVRTTGSQPDPQHMNAGELRGYMEGMRFKQEMEERKARAEFNRAEADLMRQRLRENQSGPLIPGTTIPRADVERELALAKRNFQWCSDHPDGGDVPDKDGKLVHFTKEQVDAIRISSFYDIRLWSEMIDRKPPGQ